MAGIEAVVAAIRARSGVVPTRVLGEQGIGRRAIAAAVAAGVVVAPRRGWLAVPYADPALIAAARSGVVLTCVTRCCARGAVRPGDRASWRSRAGPVDAANG